MQYRLLGRLAREGPQLLRSAHVARRGEILSGGAAHFFWRARHSAPIAVIGNRPGGAIEGPSADAVERGDARHCGERNSDIAVARILLVEPRGQGRQIEGIARHPAPDPRTRVVAQQYANPRRHFARTVKPEQRFFPFHPQLLTQHPRRQHFGKAEPDAEPAKTTGQRHHRTVGAAALLKRHRVHPFYGLSTTLTQPSSLSRNVLYIRGPSSRATL